MDLTISLPVIFLLANFFYEALATNALNLYSECICWAILTLTFAAVSRLARRGELKGSETDKGKEDGGTSLVMAGAIVVSCLCRRQGSVTWTMVSRSVSSGYNFAEKVSARRGSRPLSRQSSVGMFNSLGSASRQCLEASNHRNPCGSFFGDPGSTSNVSNPPLNGTQPLFCYSGMDNLQWRPP